MGYQIFAHQLFILILEEASSFSKVKAPILSADCVAISWSLAWKLMPS